MARRTGGMTARRRVRPAKSGNNRRLARGARRRNAPKALVPTKLLRQVVAHLKPRRVILFGSRASGEGHADSDWDLLIVVDDDVPAERFGWRALHEARRGFPGAVDLLPCRESAFRERAAIVGSLPWIAATEGVVVYERAD